MNIRSGLMLSLFFSRGFSETASSENQNEASDTKLHEVIRYPRLGEYVRAGVIGRFDSMRDVPKGIFKRQAFIEEIPIFTASDFSRWGENGGCLHYATSTHPDSLDIDLWLDDPNGPVDCDELSLCTLRNPRMRLKRQGGDCTEEEREIYTYLNPQSMDYHFVGLARHYEEQTHKLGALPATPIDNSMLDKDMPEQHFVVAVLTGSREVTRHPAIVPSYKKCPDLFCFQLLRGFDHSGDFHDSEPEL